MSERHPNSEHSPLPATPENVASFLSMAKEIGHEEARKPWPLYHRETPQFIRFYDAPVPTNLWLQHLEEVEKNRFRASHVIANEVNSLLIYTHEFHPEWEEGMTITPSSSLYMPKLSPGIVNDTYGAIERDELFSPISDEQFAHLYADMRWLYSGLRR